LFLDFFFFIVACSIFAVVFAATTRSQSNVNGKDKLLSQKVSDNNVPDFHAFNWRLCKVLGYFKSNFHHHTINFLNE